MARLINRPTDVTLGPGFVPSAFRYAGQRHFVRQVLDRWLEVGRWWEREAERTTYRVVTAGGGIFELTWDSGEKRWYLYKSYD